MATARAILQQAANRDLAKPSPDESPICPLTGLNEAFHVGRRRPLSDLPFWKRLVIRWSYRITGWCTGDGVESLAITTDEELAREMASRPGGFYEPLPLNVALPDQICFYKCQAFPLSDDERARKGKIRSRLVPRVVPVLQSDLNAIQEGLARLL